MVGKKLISSDRDGLLDAHDALKREEYEWEQFLQKTYVSDSVKSLRNFERDQVCFSAYSTVCEMMARSSWAEQRVEIHMFMNLFIV